MGAMKTTYENVCDPKTHATPETGSSIAERIYSFTEKNEFVLLGVILLAVTVSAIVCSLHKQFWLDEIFTIVVASQPDLHHFAAAMPAEGNPPLNTFLTRLAIKAFGISQISVRLVPLLGFLTALSGVYIFVRREAGRVFGILALLLVIFGPVWRYSYEARPYGILLGSFMMALVGWQSATHIKDSNLDRSRVPALICMALGILGCAFSHYIGLIEIGAPLLVGEAVRMYLRRRIDWAVVCTGFCCLPSLFVILPMVRHTSDIVVAKSTILQRPSMIEKIHSYYRFAAISWPLVMDDRIVGLAFAVALVTWAPFSWKRSATRVSDNSVHGIRTYVLWASLAASLLIPITWLAMFYGKGWYFCRYGIGSALGIVLWFCLLLAKRKIRLPELLATVVLVVSMKYLVELVRELHASGDMFAFSESATFLPTGGNELIRDHPSDLPVVVSNSFFYPSIWWYASAAEKPRVVFLTGPYNSGEVITSGILAEKPYFHAPILDFDSFTSRTSHFLLELDDSIPDGSYMDSRKLLESRGFEVKKIARKDHFTLFDVIRREQPSEP